MNSKQDLIERAKSLGVAGYSRMNKKALRENISQAETGSAKGLEIVREVVATATKDVFPVGAVIRWQARQYTYAALKAGNGQWYTTSASFNTFVPQILDFDDLMDVITRAEVEEVAVATAWETIG